MEVGNAARCLTVSQTALHPTKNSLAQNINRVKVEKLRSRVYVLLEGGNLNVFIFKSPVRAQDLAQSQNPTYFAGGE